MKMLIIGDVFSVFVHDLVKEMRKESLFHSIDGLMLKRKARLYPTSLDRLYQPFITAERPGFVKKISDILRYLYLKKIFSDIVPYDIVHIHYLDPALLYFWKEIRQLSNHIIITIWGSDFLRADEATRNALKPMLADCHRITCANEKLRDQISEYYSDLPIPEKITICRFGLSLLESLKNSRMEKSEAKIALSLPPDHTVVTVGYNASPGQQHEKVIDILQQTDSSLLKNLCFIFPLTYGNTKYKQFIKKKLEGMQFTYKVIEQYMYGKEMVLLRKATDIYIHLPVTDQLSASLQENLFEGNVVITGSWLPYAIFRENGLAMISIDDLRELPGALMEALNQSDVQKERKKKNAPFIWNLSSWESCRTGWIHLYKEMVR